MADMVRDPDGKIWEQGEDGKWYEVTGARAGGVLAGEGMGRGEALLVGTGRELARLGRGAERLALGVLPGGEKRAARLAELEAEANEQIAGTRAARPDLGAAMTAGSMLPALATLPVGFGIGGVASRGALSLAEQTALSGLMGGIGYSGDQGMDAMTSALLGAGGWGAGNLAGKVVGMIRARGAATRAAITDAQDAARAAATGAASSAGEGAAAGGVAGGAGGARSGGAAAGAGDEALRLGAATRPGAEALAAGGALPGAAAGAPGVTEEMARLAKRAEDLGFQLTPGQRAGSLVQQQTEASLKSSPWTAGLFEGAKRNNEARLNKLAVRAIGEEGNELSQRVLNNAHERIGQTFEGVAGHVGTLPSSSAALTKASEDLAGIVRAAGEGAAVVPEVGAAAGRLAKIWEEGGQVTGERLLRERTRLVKLGRNFSRNGDQLAAEGIHDVVGVIDDVIAGSVPKAMRRAVNEARGQWRILSTLEHGAAIDAAGNVRAGALFPALRREFPVEMVRGGESTVFGRSKAGARGRDLMDAVRITQAFRDVVGDSGTATRMSLQGLLAHPLETIVQGGVMRGLGALYMGPGGRLGSELALAPNVAPRAGAGGGGVLRGFGGAGGGGGLMGSP